MDTFLGDRSTAIWFSVAARNAHLEAAAQYRLAAYYRRSEWLGFRIGRYVATINHRELIARHRRSAEHYAKVARLLEQDARNAAEARRRNAA